MYAVFYQNMDYNQVITLKRKVEDGSNVLTRDMLLIPPIDEVHEVLLVEQLI